MTEPNGGAGAPLLPVRISQGLAGRPPKNTRIFLDRARPQLAAKWVRSCRRALVHLNDTTKPIDANWIRLFNSLADRLGYARRTEQVGLQGHVVGGTIGLHGTVASEEKVRTAARALLAEIIGDEQLEVSP